jgi:hypothetical protein
MSVNALTVAEVGKRQRGVRRTAITLGVIAAVFYVGFIAMMIWRATR